MTIPKRPKAVLSFDEKGKPRITITEEFLRENVKKIVERCNGGKPTVKYLKEGGVLFFKSIELADDAYWSINEYFPEVKLSIAPSAKELRRKTKQQMKEMPYDF